MSLPIRSGHIGVTEAVAITSVAGITNVFLNYPEQLVEYGKQAGWQIPIVSTFVVLIVLLLFRQTLSLSKNQDVLSIGERRLARLLFGLLTIVTVVYFIITTASEMRQFAETVKGTVLSRSPISYIALPLLMIVSYFAFYGIEGISRLTTLFAPLIIIGILFLIVGNYNWMHLEYLYPFFGTGIDQVMIHGMLFTTAFPNLLLLTLFTGVLRNTSDVAKVGIYSTLIIGASYILFTITYIAIFPPQLSVHLTFPAFQMARIINIGRFFQRMEAGFIFIWVACAVIKMSIGVWATSYLFARLFGMPIYKPLVFSTALVIYGLSFIPRSYPEVVSWDSQTLQRYGGLVTVVIPVLLLLMSAWKRREHGEKKIRRVS